jgi:hypothetical protein
VFYYDDGKYSKGKALYHWPQICEKMGWDMNAVCGPNAMSGNRANKGSAFDCLDPNHK